MEASYWMPNRTTRRRFLRGISMAAGTLSLAPVIAACSGTKRGGSSPANTKGTEGPLKGGTLTSSMAGDVGNLDYAFDLNGFDRAVIADCVEALLTVDAQGRASGLLATGWENPDDRTYVFKLRPGVTFQDGTDFNADAVEYSLGRIRGSKTSPSYPQLVSVDTVEKPDQRTLRLTLSGPFAPFLYNLTGDAGRVISPAIGEKYGKDRLKVDLTGQGTGPFKFVEWKTGDGITLARNERYWGSDAAGMQLPYVDKLIYRVIPDQNQALSSLRTGEIDVIQLAQTGAGGTGKDTASVKAAASLSYRDGPGLNCDIVFLNEAKAPFSSRELRQALSYAIDRSALAQNVFFDTALPLDVIFGPAIWAYDADYHPYQKRDVGKAKQLLAQAGKPNGFAFTLSIGNTAVGQQMAELLKDQLREAGIEMTIQLMQQAQLDAALRAGEHQATTINYSALLAPLDPDTWVYPFFSSKGALNSFTRYGNKEVDRLLEQARTTLDQSTRKPLYQQAQRLFMDDAAVCVIVDRSAVALSGSKVHNVPLGPTPTASWRVSQIWKSA